LRRVIFSRHITCSSSVPSLRSQAQPVLFFFVRPKAAGHLYDSLIQGKHLQPLRAAARSFLGALRLFHRTGEKIVRHERPICDNFSSEFGENDACTGQRSNSEISVTRASCKTEEAGEQRIAIYNKKGRKCLEVWAPPM
jgi:hypothetical protein